MVSNEIVQNEIAEARAQRKDRTAFRPLEPCDDVEACDCGDMPSLVSYSTETGAPTYMCEICHSNMWQSKKKPVSAKIRRDVLRLLEDWIMWIQDYINSARSRLESYPGHIQETSQIPFGFDYEASIKLNAIQHELSELVPQFADLIRLNPCLPGEWTPADYLELYVAHYHIVIDKLYRLVRGVA